MSETKQPSYDFLDGLSVVYLEARTMALFRTYYQQVDRCGGDIRKVNPYSTAPARLAALWEAANAYDDALYRRAGRRVDTNNL